MVQYLRFWRHFGLAKHQRQKILFGVWHFSKNGAQPCSLCITSAQKNDGVDAILKSFGQFLKFGNGLSDL